MLQASGLTRNSTVFATSSAVPKRLSGAWRFSMSNWNCTDSLVLAYARMRSFKMEPGTTALQRTPRSPYWTATERVSALMPALQHA